MKDAGTSTDRMDAFIQARNAHKEWARKFKGKDIIDQLTSMKRGVQDTPQIDPSMVMDKVYMGKQGLGNLRKVKKLLTDSPNEASMEMWRNISGAVPWLTCLPPPRIMFQVISAVAGLTISLKINLAMATCVRAS